MIPQYARFKVVVEMEIEVKIGTKSKVTGGPWYWYARDPEKLGEIIEKEVFKNLPEDFQKEYKGYQEWLAAQYLGQNTTSEDPPAEISLAPETTAETAPKTPSETEIPVLWDTQKKQMVLHQKKGKNKK